MQNPFSPKGDDPLTTGQVDHAIVITTGALSGTLAGVRLTFLGHTIEFSANGDEIHYIRVSDDLSGPPQRRHSVVLIRNCRANKGQTYTITFTQFAKYPRENNFFCTMEPQAYQTLPVIPLAQRAALRRLANYSSVTGTKEYAMCSNRGSCPLIQEHVCTSAF